MPTLNEHERALVNGLKGRESIMLDNTRHLSSINSGSFNLEGIKETNKILVALFSAVSDNHQVRKLARIPVVSDTGEVEELPTDNMHLLSSRPHAPLQLLCTGHSDTVFPKDSAFQSTRIDGNLLRGPGVADMKGGLMVLLEALRVLENSRFRELFGFTVAISPDEEIGSPASSKVLSELAKKANFGLTFEPALGDGTLAGARKGSGNFTVVARGKSAHAGRHFFSGRNAITAVARLSILLEDLSNESLGVSVNIGKITGGGAVNVVPDLAVCRFNVRVQSSDQMVPIENTINSYLHEIQNATQCQLSLHGNFNRPPKLIDEKQQYLFDLVENCGSDLGIAIKFKDTGGCCEGNNLAAAGLVNIDTLGVRGGNIHSEQEFTYIDSFVERARLSALLIARLCDNATI